MTTHAPRPPADARGGGVRARLVRGLLAVQNGLLRATTLALFGPARPVAEPRRILLLRSSRLGDFLNVIPALVALRRRFPDARIAMVTTASASAAMKDAVARSTEGAAAGLPWLDFVRGTLVDEFFLLPAGSPLAERDRLRAWVTAFAPDATFLLAFAQERPLSKLKKLLLLRVAGVRGAVHGWRVHQHLGLWRGAQHAAGMLEHQVVGPLRGLAEHPSLADVLDRPPEFAVTIAPEAARWADDVVARHGAGRRLVAVFPGGTFAHKRWPAERFAEVCERLAAASDVAFVVVGGREDVEAARVVAERLGPLALDLAGGASLPQLAALLARCALLVGNDSGPMHLGAAVGVPVVSVMSAIEYPGIWEPWTSRDLAVRHRVPCEGCYGFTGCPTGTQACIRGIAVDAVLARAEVGLTHAPARRLPLAPAGAA